MTPCQCGHASHKGRCQPAPFGCPCREYEPAERAKVLLLPGESSTYYQGVRPVVVHR